MANRAYVFVALLLCACVPARVPVTDVGAVLPEELAAALKVEAYTLEGSRPPVVARYLGPVRAFSCKHLLTDPPASRGDALTQLRVEALRLGADGIIDVTFDVRGTDALGTNCWQSVQASGTAVKFAR